MATPTRTIVAIIMGNSSLSAAILEGPRILDKMSLPIRSEEGWPRLFAWLEQRGQGCPKVAASVNPVCLKTFEARLTEPLIVLGRDRPIPVQNLTEKPEETGHDRLLSAYGAVKLYGVPLLMVDCGTAVTFNCIDRTGAFLGGAIAPGMGLWATALGQGCAQLPAIDPTELGPLPLIGRTTASAVRSGILNGFVAMVDALVKRYRETWESSAPLVVTGGEGRFFTSRTSLDPVYDPDLLVKGIALAFQMVEAD